MSTAGRGSVRAAFRAAVAMLLMLSLGGLGAGWIPSLGVLIAALAVLHLSSRVPHGSRSFRLGTLVDALRPYGFALALAAIALAGLAFRLQDSGHGLWHTETDIDERRLAESVLHFFRTGEVDHSTVEHYPGLHFWLLTGSFLLTYLYALLSGLASGLDALPQEVFVWAGRVTNAFVEAGSVVITGLVGRLMAGRAAGLLAALVFAVSPLAIEISTQLRNEAGLTFFITAAAYVSVLAVRRPTVPAGLASGALAGAAMAIKYSGLFAWLPALVAAATATPAARLRQVLLVTVGFGLALAVTNHFIWADFPNFVRQLATEVVMTGSGHWSAQANPRWFYVTILADQGVGWPLLVVAGAVGVWGLASANRYAWILLSFPVPYIWFMTKQPAQFPRWVYPLTPFVALGGVVGVLYLARLLRSRLTEVGGSVPSRAGRLTVAAVLLIVLVPPVWMGAREVSRRLATPTYTRAEAWLASTVAPGNRILAPHKWLDLDDLPVDVTRVWDFERELAGGDYQFFQYQWVLVPEPWFEHPALERLSLVGRIASDRSFRGSRGFDFRFYTPKPMPLLTAVDVDPGSEAAAPYLGAEWPRGPSRGPGAVLPEDGAELYVPRPTRTDSRVELDVQWTAAGSVAMSPVRVTVADREVSMSVAGRTPDRLRLISEPLGDLATDRITRVRLTPAGVSEGRLRVLRFSVR